MIILTKVGYATMKTGNGLYELDQEFQAKQDMVLSRQEMIAIEALMTKVVYSGAQKRIKMTRFMK